MTVTLRTVLTRATPSTAASRPASAGSRSAVGRVPPMVCGETKMSAPRVVFSQSVTVRRKLAIMIPTPTITLTAIVNAATAIAVRLRERITSRGAMRPTTPNNRAVSGVIRRMAAIRASGVSRALPTTIRNRAAKLTVTLRVGAFSTAMPSRTRTSAAAVMRGVMRCERPSTSERSMVPAGGVRVAS